ncbi:MAG: hypothetical protein BWY83_02877 [bacterium ADurb.Bin478]|nr:MAG: hypothetical protein BWY83_02877 [bacterium ADurb.Bin478]
MLHTGFHIHDQGLILIQDQISDQSAEEHALRTGTAAAASIDGAQHDQRDAAVMECKTVGYIADLRIQAKDLSILLDLGAGALLDQRHLFGDRHDLLLLLQRNAEGGGEIGIRIGVHRQHTMPFGCQR